MRVRKSQMKSREALSIGQDSSNSCFRLLGRQFSLFSSLVVVALTLRLSAGAPSAAADVSSPGICLIAKFPLCVPFTVLSIGPPCHHRGRGCNNDAAPYSAVRRPRSVVAHVQYRIIPVSKPALWNLRETLHGRQGRHQQGPHGRQRQREQQRECGARFLPRSGVWPNTHKYSNCFFTVTRGCFQQTSAKPLLFLTVTATVGHTANTAQRWMLRRQSCMKERYSDTSTLKADGAIRSTSCPLNSVVVTELTTGRRLGEGSQAGHSKDVNTAGVASIIQRTSPLQAGVERLWAKKQQRHSAALQEERRQGTTSLKAGLSASTDVEANSSLPCARSFPVKKESWSPCLHNGETQQEKDVVAADVAFPFPRLGLFPNFVEALTHLGVHNATEIQQLGLPAIFSGADIVLGAETGSGKTLGYLLGILQNVLVQKMIHERKEDEAMMSKDDLPIPRHYPYAIVVVPTRELALQVAAWSRRLSRKTPISAQLLLGSYARWPFGTLTLPTSPDIIVCTPQVLAGFTRGGGYKKQLPLFEQAQMLVVDEADMLLEGGYKHLMESIFLEFRKSDKQLAAAGKRRTQYIFAAATIPERGPVSIRKTIGTLCPGASFLCTNSLHCQRRELQQEFVEIRADASFDERTGLLVDKLREIPLTERVMIFCNTAQTAGKVLQVLEKALPPDANPKLFSSDLDQKDRTRNLGLFAREKSKVLVCTDAASRGLDIVGVTNVIQFDFALNAATHLHRVGRVARAGKFGRAINFYEPVSKPLADAVRKAAYDPTRTSLAEAFSRKRSFRKSLKKTEKSSVALVVDCPSPAGGVPTTLEGVD